MTPRRTADAGGGDAGGPTAAGREGGAGPGLPGGAAATTFRLGASSFFVLSLEPTAAPLPATVSAAERDVAVAILRSASNREIARRRGTSPRTVANQVAALFRKLRVRSRAELAARYSGAVVRGGRPPPGSTR